MRGPTKKNTKVVSGPSMTIKTKEEDGDVRFYVKIGSRWYNCWCLNSVWQEKVKTFVDKNVKSVK